MVKFQLSLVMVPWPADYRQDGDAAEVVRHGSVEGLADGHVAIRLDRHNAGGDGRQACLVLDKAQVRRLGQLLVLHDEGTA